MTEHPFSTRRTVKTKYRRDTLGVSALDNYRIDHRNGRLKQKKKKLCGMAMRPASSNRHNFFVRGPPAKNDCLQNFWPAKDPLGTCSSEAPFFSTSGSCPILASQKGLRSRRSPCCSSTSSVSATKKPREANTCAKSTIGTKSSGRCWARNLRLLFVPPDSAVLINTQKEGDQVGQKMSKSWMWLPLRSGAARQQRRLDGMILTLRP